MPHLHISLLQQRVASAAEASCSYSCPRPAPCCHLRRQSQRQRRQGRGAQQQQHAISIRVLGLSNDAYRGDDDSEDLLAPEVPTTFELSQRPDKEKPLVKVRLSVHYRVHSRQLLCIGGSQIPFGWSFLSIAKVPMTWNTGDIWTCEVELQAGQRIEYKYVILEEQDWTKLENDDSQGLVEISYRSGADHPGRPPDVQVIQKQMAIVAWQPGPNRVLQVPSEAELDQLRPGDVLERIPPRPNQKLPYETTGKVRAPPPLKADPFEGTWEVLMVDVEQKPFVDRHDIWGWVSPSGPNNHNNRPPGPLKGILPFNS